MIIPSILKLLRMETARRNSSWSGVSSLGCELREKNWWEGFWKLLTLVHTSLTSQIPNLILSPREFNPRYTDYKSIALSALKEDGKINPLPPWLAIVEIVWEPWRLWVLFYSFSSEDVGAIVYPTVHWFTNRRCLGSCRSLIMSIYSTIFGTLAAGKKSHGLRIAKCRWAAIPSPETG